MTEQELWEFWKERECVDDVQDLKGIQFLPFIGAGMSVNFGYPTWPDFLQSVIERYASLSEQERLRKMLAEQAFLLLAEALDKDSQNGIEAVVRRHFHPNKLKEVAPAQNYVKLLQSMGIRAYVTTNYDTVLERYAPEAGKKVILPTTLQTTGEFEELERTRQPFLLKLHGTYNNPDSIVLTQWQYEKHYPQDQNAVNPAVLRRLWRHETLLFLGCSLEKDYLVERMLQLSGENRRIHHYAIVEWPQLPQRQQERERELLRLKIRPIWYPQGDHSCVCTILSMLAGGDGPGAAEKGDLGGADAQPPVRPRLKPAAWGNLLRPEAFLGRKEKKEELGERLQDADLVFLSGVGGIGKSELAGQYGRDQARAGKTVVRMFYHPGQPGAEDPVEASGLRRLLLEMTVLDDPDFSGLPPEDGAARGAYYRRKLLRLRQLCGRDTLLVIDNFDVAGDEGLEDLQSLGAQVILTTRQDFRPHFAQVDLNELEEEDAYRLFLRHAALGEDDREAEARELIRQVGRHTTAVILLAAQKEADGLTTGPVSYTHLHNSQSKKQNDRPQNQQNKKPNNRIHNSFEIISIHKISSELSGKFIVADLLSPCHPDGFQTGCLLHGQKPPRMAGALTDQPAINALVCLRLALCQRGGQSVVFAVILPCPLEIAIPKLLLGPDHSNGVQPENLCRGQLGFFRPLGLQPVIEPVAIRALVSGRNLKISVCPVVIRRVPKSGLPRVLLPPHPRKLEYFQSFRSFRRQLPALEPLALTVNPGCNFPFLIGFGALFLWAACSHGPGSTLPPGGSWSPMGSLLPRPCQCTPKRQSAPVSGAFSDRTPFARKSTSPAGSRPRSGISASLANPRVL